MLIFVIFFGNGLNNKYARAKYDSGGHPRYPKIPKLLPLHTDRSFYAANSKTVWSFNCMGWLHFCSLPNKHNSVHSLDCSWEQYYRPQTITAHWLHRTVDWLHVVPAPQVNPQGRVAHCGRTRGPLCPGFCKCAHAALKPVHHSHLLLGKCYQSHFSDGDF